MNAARRFQTSWLISVAMWGIFTTVPSCATQEKSQDPLLSRTHYTLREGETLAANPPLPSMKPVYVDWHHTDGHVESRLAYRLYDMNRGGHIDYMEILGPRGEVLTTHADLDFDGRVDKTTQVDPAH